MQRNFQYRRFVETPENAAMHGKVLIRLATIFSPFGICPWLRSPARDPSDRMRWVFYGEPIMLMIANLSCVADARMPLANRITARMSDSMDSGDRHAWCVDIRHPGDVPINRWDVWQFMRRRCGMPDANDGRA